MMDTKFLLPAAVAFGVPLALNSFQGSPLAEGHTPISEGSKITTGKAALAIGAIALLYGVAGSGRHVGLAKAIGVGALGSAGLMAYYDSQHQDDQSKALPPFPFPFPKQT